MHCIDDKPNGIILNHNSDWSGDMRIAWYAASERHTSKDDVVFHMGTGPRPPDLRQCWCDAPDLVAGRFTRVSGPPDEEPPSDPPIHVLTRAVALAVEKFLRSKMESALDDLFIKRGKL